MNGYADAAVKAKIKKQVEFYFSDSNAPRDKFLMERIKAHPEGFVELATICAFTRMAQALNLPLGLTPAEVRKDAIQLAADALKDSTELEVSQDKMFVKRRQPLESEEKMLADIDARSVYAKPLPFDCTLETLTNFFSTYGGVKAIRLRRRPDNKDFKGSIFVEFDSPETAEKVAIREDVVHEGAVLRMEKKVEYLERKRLARQEKAEQLANGTQPAKSTPRARHLPTEQCLAVPSFEPGLVLRFDILPEFETPADLHYKEIKNAFGGHEGGVIYVEYNKGGREGFLRLANPNRLKSCLERKDADGNFEVSKLKVSVRLLEGEEEKDYYIRRALTNREAEAREDTKRKPERGRGRFGKRGRMQ